MSEVKEERRGTSKRVWITAGAILSLAILLSVIVFVYVVFRFVPPISAQVVDAVTQEPIPGMNVCLQVHVLNWERHEVPRQVVSKTNHHGKFGFFPSVQNVFMSRWEGYSIRVTDPDGFWGSSTCGSATYGDLLNEVHPGGTLDPSRDRTRYFPVLLIQPGDGMNEGWEWGSTRRPIQHSIHMRIPLIPVLTDMAECSKIPDSGLAEDCRRINTSFRAVR